jgi:protein-L-isoaspartate(D-aspartate) O-methyltransferase
MRSTNTALLFAILCLYSLTPKATDYTAARQEMITLIEADVTLTHEHLQRASLNRDVMRVMNRVPRHLFVPEAMREHAYENRPLPIGFGQTISQPYIVAIMTDLIDPQPEDRSLEVGTGSGYQAAVLSQLVKKVHSLEIIEPLGKQAKARLTQLGYNNIDVKIGDGYFGWEEHAPFDIIIVTAAASHIPPPLVKQLKPGGRMIIPVGSRFMTQQLLLVNKDQQKEIHIRQILPVRFVPLTGEH